MNGLDHLPELPLMLAHVPRAVSDLLRDAGVPAEPLPRVALAASGSGRYVLFDSREARSAALARHAAEQGLVPVDIARFAADPAEFTAPVDHVESSAASTARAIAARSFLEQLKNELEQQGGLWIRLADYPFPYQSAICVTVEHLSDELAELRSIAAALPGRATHFVSTRLRPDRLAMLADAGPVDLGWQIRPEDCRRSARSTLSHWTTRMARFREAGVAPAGLAMASREPAIPPARALWPLGLRYACLPHGGPFCRAESFHGMPDATWLRLGATPLPPRERFVEWVGEHYQSGCGLIVSATTARIDLIQELLCLAGDAARCSLMWQTTLSDFARWWTCRSRMRLQVRRVDGGCDIHAGTELHDYAWGIEIWRGNHLATLPLKQPELHVADDGLVYLRAHKRNPAGCTTPSDAVLELAAARSSGDRAE